jgi:cytoskeletal protein RodZ
MTIKASGRSALILAAGLWIGFGIGFVRPSLAAAGDTGANSAATTDNSTKHGSRHKKEAHGKSDKPADKSASDAKAAAPAASDGGDNAPAVQSAQMPPTVANANAQVTPTDSPADSAKAMSERVTNILQGIPDETADAPPAAGTPVVAADQLNDMDRALHEATPPATPVALASADAPVPASAAAGNSDNSTWDQTSLIGKIFIGFGALLTMASAARMFMA